jgi:hypothetical protein
MEEEDLPALKHSPFAMTMLAAKYVFESKGNEPLRLDLKN